MRGKRKKGKRVHASHCWRGVNDNQVRDHVISSKKSILMLDKTAGRGMDVLATDNFETLLVRLNKSEVLSLAVNRQL